MNGRGDDTITMLKGYGHRVDFFTSFDWWTMEPHDEMANTGNYCLAVPGQIYVVYLPHGGRATVQVRPGRYVITRWNPVTGQKTGLPAGATGPVWISPESPPEQDWVLLIERQ